MSDYLKEWKEAISKDARDFYQSLSGKSDAQMQGLGHNDDLDAFRHAYTSGRVSQLTFDWVAEYFGNKNELPNDKTKNKNKNDPYEHRMDLWNNEIGRRFAQQNDNKGELATKLYQELSDGKLATNIQDKRIQSLYSNDPRLLSDDDGVREVLSESDVEKINQEIDLALKNPNAQTNQNPLNSFQDQLDAAANNPELKDSVEQVENEFKDKATINEDIPSYDQWFDKKYTEWFDTEFSQWFDTNYETYLNEQYDDYLDDQYFEQHSNKNTEWSNEKYAQWYSEQHWELHDEKYDEWQDEKYFDWYYEQYYELNDEKYAEWYSEKHWELYDEKYSEWEDEKYFDWYYDEYYGLSDEKYADWYSDKHWETYDEKYDEWQDEKYYDWKYDYDGEEDGYDEWFDESYDEWFDESYDEWFDEYYSEWFSEQYDEWFDEYYDEWFDESYSEWFDENYDEWFDEYYSEWFSEQYDEWFDEYYDEWFSEQYDEWFDENYDAWFDGQYDEWFNKTYDAWFDEAYEDWYQENINNDEQYNQWYDAKYSEWHDEKYTEWSSQKYQEWKNSKYDEWTGEYNNEYPSGAPVILDLDGNGIEITTLDNSNAYFDFDDDTYLEKTAWTTDAILVFDENNDGQITSSSEIAFAKLTDTDDTDLEALKTEFDSNNDGVLNANDTQFSQFKLWQDSNQNGAVDTGELQTLTQAGITSISLVSDEQQQILDDGSTVFGKTTFTKDDGTTGEVADVAFKYKTSGYKMVKTDSGYEMRLEQDSSEKGSYFHTSPDALNINLKDNNYDIVTGNIGDDTLDGSTTDYDVLISGGAGDDTLLGGSGNDILIGGAGLDTFNAGSGNDTITVNNDDILTSTYIDGGSGYDKLVIKGDSTVNVNLDELNIESVTLGDGISTVTGNSDDVNYLIIGGTNTATITTAGGRDIIYGGVSVDTINSGSGDDYIVTDNGDDVINAGDGDDVIYGGAGDDAINAGSGKDTIYLEGDLDVISGGSDADTFKLSYQDQEAKSGLTNLIKDFELGVDTLDLSNVKSMRSMDDISISSVNQNGKTYAKIDVGHNKNAIYLEGVSSSFLTKDNFEFYNHKAINLAEVTLSMSEDQSLTITSAQLLANVIDFDGDDLSVVSLSVVGSDAGNATLTDNNNGTWTLTPKANFSGDIAFNYQISDGYEATDAKAKITVEAVADKVSVVDNGKQATTYGLNIENDFWDKIGYHKLVSSYESYTMQEGSSAYLLQTTTKTGVSGTKTYSSDIDSFLTLGDSSVKDVSSQASNGSALKSNFIVSEGDTVSFHYMFDTDDYQPYVDFATYSIGNEVYQLSSVAEVGNFGNSGWKEISFVAQSSGNLGFAVLNLKDGAVNSSLLIDNVVVNAENNQVQVGDIYKLPFDFNLAGIDGSESLTIIIKGLPNSATLSHGSLLTNGYWQLTKTQYDNLEITFSEKNKTYNLTVNAISTESSNGDTNIVSQTAQVKVSSSSALTDLAFSVAEDNLLVIDKSTITNNIGVDNITITNIGSENSISSIDENGNIKIVPNDNYSGLETLSYTVVAGGNEYYGNINVEVVARADSPLLLVETNDYVFDFSSGNLNNWQTVGDVDVVSSYDGFNSADNDGYMARLTTGYGSVDQSVLESFMNMGNGKLDTFNGNATNGSAMQTVIDVKTGDIVSFEYIFSTNDYAPYNDFALVKIGDDSFKLSDVSTVGDYGASDGWQKFQYIASSNGKLNLAVANLLDTWVSSSLMIDNVVISSNNTLEVASNSTLALPITAVLNDTDGSETLSISIKNLPSEVTLNNGAKQADGSYLLSQNDLSNLQLITGNFSGHLNIEIEATSVEFSNSDTATSSKTLSIDVIQTGDANDNQLVGDEGDNIIRGLAGDDTITGIQGDDTLSGGLGSDTFVYSNNNDGNDTITDFSLSEGDKLDLSDLVDYQEGQNITDFVSVENIGNDSIVHIDSDGAGIGESYVSITLSNATLSFEDLSNADVLIVL
ncbi:cadherin-like domain-containing protein [Bathymodiolus septemdierum thioautotrophic gill symbiont]|uniref:Uncharacterized protein n=1 Tax=endosymbiont of Bathymodiolus septemdierum str. Myojin knoll TaxID=1303921 RepID=A0A0P0USV5_9GAMM|nr:cadherin-like domain-containing protein [Bathymodiolus septemdierum thioautotrophic gill symbiont]BAS68398.1 hypothetical protein BSEPE_1420 [endosymbiont of Bathymodiolus septemdierum str. Myojin knoll]